MKKLRILSLLLSFVLLLSALTSCGGEKSVRESRISSKEPENAGSEIFLDNTDKDRKITKQASLVGETRDFEECRRDIDEIIGGHDGYTEKERSSNRSLCDEFARKREAFYVIRIPAEKLDGFLNEIKGKINVISSEISTDDITAQYTDVESRLEVLKIEKESLDAMLENSKNAPEGQNIEYMLEVEKRLYDVIAEIEAFTAKLRVFKDKTDYSTVQLTLIEVLDYTNTKEPVTFGERFSRAFKESWVDFAKGFKNFIIGFVEVFPSLLVTAVICGGIVWIVIGSRRRSKKRKTVQIAEKKENQK